MNNLNKSIISMDNFLLVESKINSIFQALLDTKVNNGIRVLDFIETKPYLEKLKFTLSQISKTNDALLKNKSEELSRKIDIFIKEFSSKYLEVNTENFKKESIDLLEERVVPINLHIQNNLEPKIDINKESINEETFFILVNGSVVKTHRGSTDSLLNLLNTKFSDKKPIVIKGKELKLNSRTIFTL